MQNLSNEEFLRVIYQNNEIIRTTNPIQFDTIQEGHIEILPDEIINIHLFDNLNHLSDEDKEYCTTRNCHFDEITIFKENPDRPVQDEADVCSMRSLSREDFIKELRNLKITEIYVNGELVDKNKLVLT